MYQELYNFFLLKSEQNSPNEIATVLNAYATYESAKSEAGILLSTKDFNELNPTLSREWEKICNKLNI
jgi:hypothetical protein